MGLFAVFAVLLEPGLLLEDLHRGFRLAAELTVHGQRRAQLIQQFLQGFDIRARGALFQKAGSGDRLYGLLRLACIAVIDEGQLQGRFFTWVFTHPALKPCHSTA